MSDKVVLLLGSYGQTNLGDDLLMWNYLALLRERGVQKIYVNASVAKNIPEVIRREFSEMSVLLTYKTSVLQWAKIIKAVDCIVYGGGTIFKELYSSTGRGKYSVIVRIMLFNLLARFLGTRVYHLHIGIGVLKTWLGRQITRSALKSAELTIFRDKKSHTVASQLGVPADKVCLATDGLFINDRWQKVWQPADVQFTKAANKKVVGVNLLADIPDWVDLQTYVKTARSFIKNLLDGGDTVVLVPFQHDFNPHNDRVFMSQEIATHFTEYKNLVMLDRLPIEQAVAVFKSFDAFVGMRFHSLLLAASTGTPFLGIAYDTKCWRFIEENNYPYAVKLEQLTEPSLTDAFLQLMQNKVATRELLQKITEDQRKQGQKCINQISF